MACATVTFTLLILHGMAKFHLFIIHHSSTSVLEIFQLIHPLIMTIKPSCVCVQQVIVQLLPCSVYAPHGRSVNQNYCHNTKMRRLQCCRQEQNAWARAAQAEEFGPCRRSIVVRSVGKSAFPGHHTAGELQLTLQEEPVCSEVAPGDWAWASFGLYWEK